MKKILHIVFLLIPCTLLSTMVVAQKYGYTWYFSSSRGIDFNSGAAVLLTTSGMSEYEGCSSMSDPVTGSILMYSDGMKVWDKDHAVMQNGTNLKSTYAAGQQALIVPQPGNPNIFYLFTSGEYYSGGSDGYRYNIIDMSLNGGLGGVTATKNILLYKPASEKQCAIKNPSGNYWIATHEFSTNTFRVYELSDTGLSAPVMSSTGSSFTSINSDGCMKFSPDGSRIALTLGGSNNAEVFDFDILTGIVSNPITLGPIFYKYPYVYGICFSPNGKRLYVTEENSDSLMQYDLAAGTASQINASKTVIDTTTSYAMQTMQLAPDGKMYVARNGGDHLAVVNYPDSIGTACGFVNDGFYLGGGSSSYGLPNFPEDLFYQPGILQIQFSAADPSLCEKFCTDFFDQSTNNPIAWQWLFEGGDPSSSTSKNPENICYNVPGSYDVTLITTTASGDDTLTLSNYITVNPTPATPVITQIGNELTCSSADSYQWQFNAVDIPGATNQSYTIVQAGLYSVIITDGNGCQNSASVKVTGAGIEDEVSAGSIFIYPNPSTGSFMIELPESLSAGKISLRLTNSIGQELFSLEKNSISNEWQKEITLENIPPGIYWLQVKSENLILNKRIIISK